MSYQTGNICKWYENGFGSCFCNGSRCVNPFSNEGCKIQCKEIFHTDSEGTIAKRYEPSEKQLEELKKADIYKDVCLRKGDMIGDYFIPYLNLEIGFDPSREITHGFKVVEEKFEDAEIDPQCVEYSIWHNVKAANMNGIYILGCCRQ